ncbi:MAG: PQQ-binding-like beta-propeller repeat protein [Planctomycetaceae bacterium]
MNRTFKRTGWAAAIATTAVLSTISHAEQQSGKYDPTAEALAEISTMQVGKYDWPQWSGWNGRNNTPSGKNIASTWNVEDGTNIKWSAKLGSQTFGNPVVANGKVYVGTNNNAGYVKRYPPSIDLGCLLCFDEKTGEFLWQHSSEKLPTGRVHDWPQMGICCAPFIDGERGWFVTSRGEVVCFDTEGFRDGENDGPFTAEANDNKDEADVVWRFDMMGELGTSQHNMCSCSITGTGDVLFVNTANGVDESHIKLPAPNAPSFFAINRNTGKVLWTDNSPGENIMHGQWSSPAYAVIGEVPQVLFAGGDGWLYSFDARGDGKGHSAMLWKFDCNPKNTKWVLGGRGTRNEPIATPVIYDGLVYIAVGQDPEHGEGPGRLWCIDPNKRGDVSSELAVDSKGQIVPPRRLDGVDPDAGEKAVPNPNSALVWKFEKTGANFDQQMHRTLGTVAIKDDILYIADLSGLFHCLDAKTGAQYWTYDMLAACWGTPLIVDGKVFIGDEDGDMAIFKHSKDPQVALKDVNGEMKPAFGDIFMGSAVYSTPIVANDVLFIANRTNLYAIAPSAK